MGFEPAFPKLDDQCLRPLYHQATTKKRLLYYYSPLFCSSANDVKTRRKYVTLVDSVRENGGDVRIFSSLHISGERKYSCSAVVELETRTDDCRFKCRSTQTGVDKFGGVSVGLIPALQMM